MAAFQTEEKKTLLVDNASSWKLWTRQNTNEKIKRYACQASAVGLDKRKTKKLMRNRGIKTHEKMPGGDIIRLTMIV
jgi:hypothetical protein